MLEACMNEIIFQKKILGASFMILSILRRKYLFGIYNVKLMGKNPNFMGHSNTYKKTAYLDSACSPTDNDR